MIARRIATTVTALNLAREIWLTLLGDIFMIGLQQLMACILMLDGSSLRKTMVSRWVTNEGRPRFSAIDMTVCTLKCLIGSQVSEFSRH